MIRVVDIESTGLDPKTEAIVEIASVDLVRGGGITNAMHTFVNPGRPIPPIASSIHHITDDDVKDAPSLEEVIETFKGADALIAHNADFERAWLTAHLGDVPWVCTFKCALRVYPLFEAHNNQFLRYQLGLESPFGIARDKISPHRAASDVIVTAAIFEKLLDKAKWAEMVAWSDEPGLYTRIPFGKYRGKIFGSVADDDPDYLMWVVEKSELDQAAKFSAKYWLEQRQAA